MAPIHFPPWMIATTSRAVWYDSHFFAECQNGYGYDPGSSSFRNCAGRCTTVNPSGVFSILDSPVNIIRLTYMRRHTNTLKRFMFDSSRW